MRSGQAVAGDGRAPATAARVSAGAELDGLRATCRRQAHVIDALGQAVSTVRGGAAALKVDNAELRAENDRVRRGAARARATGRVDAGDALEAHVPLDVRAPGAARIVVAERLRDQVAASVLESALLVVSELVTNSVRHSGASAVGVVVVRVGLTETMVRVEVEDRGRAGAIAPRSADLEGGGGFGLNVVQALSERWGLERIAAGGTRVWAQLARASLSAPASAATSGVSGARSSRNGTPSNGRAAHRRRQHAKGTS
jgi:anti-sigma regulatory factor (Ser/Thr protein kinase)